MRKIFTALVILVMMALINSPLLAGSTAYADQGAYGEVIAWADGANDCFVQMQNIRIARFLKAIIN